jgi:DNA-binding winged helix-turn-helix (wHTH) protein
VIVRVDFGEVVVDTRTREIRRAGRSIPLSPKAFELLLILIESRPDAVTKTALQDRLWPDTFVVEKNVTNLVAEIRKALGDSSASPTYLRTVQRFGYALCDAAVVAPAPPAGDGSGQAVRLVWPHGRATLNDGEHVVGRAADAAVCLDDDSVSRRHARITLSGASVSLEDLGSKNGTLIGSRRVAAATPLADGDRITIGHVVLDVHFAGLDSTRTASKQATSSSWDAPS